MGRQLSWPRVFCQVDAVRRCRTLQLGQVLKSFRDTPVEYPCYRGACAPSEALNGLGNLEIIDRDDVRER